MLEAGSQVHDGRYRIVKLLGEGGQGSTYQAVDAREGRLVALKRFEVKGAGSWKAVELAEREGQVLSSLSHPLLPAFVESFEEGGALFLVTELVDGESLSSLLAAGATLDQATVAALIMDLAEATAYLHQRSPTVIHRDIKPANVVRRRDGRFCLVDFGAVRAKLSDAAGSTVVGTFGFMAPEQFQGRALPQSDTYGIGATALTVLTRQQPEDLPHKGLAIDVARALGPTSDPRLVRALSLMVQPDPDQRPAALDALVRELAPLRRPEPQAARRAFVPPRSSPSQPHPTTSGPAPAAPPLELGPPVVLANVLLTIANIAVTLAVIAFVPVLLALLSIVFGPRLRVAAATVRRAGHRAVARIERARDEAVGRAPQPAPKVRVAPARDMRVQQERSTGAAAERDHAAEEEALAAREAERRLEGKR